VGTETPTRRTELFDVGRGLWSHPRIRHCMALNHRPATDDRFDSNVSDPIAT
jgi:hypothetical protein